MNSDKQDLLNLIKDNVEIFKTISNVEYSIRCPFCGDSKSNHKATHMYIRCDNNPTQPLLYNCFKCNSKGVVNRYLLKQLGIKNADNLDIVNDLKVINVYTAKNIEVDLGNPKLQSPQYDYLVYRLGDIFDINELEKFRIVWNINNLMPLISDKRIMHILPNNLNSITFITEDKATILTRTFHQENGWKKLSLFKTDYRSFYSIQTAVELFTENEITINIAEGIFDVISLYKHFNSENSIFIAVLGSDYESAIKYIIQKGFVGSNINIKIFIDDNINEKMLKNNLRRYNWLFKDIKIFRNIKFKDFGTTIDNIKLLELK